MNGCFTFVWDTSHPPHQSHTPKFNTSFLFGTHHTHPIFPHKLTYLKLCTNINVQNCSIYVNFGIHPSTHNNPWRLPYKLYKGVVITNSKDIKDSNAIYFSSKTTNATTIPRILSICESSKTTIHQETHTLHTENHYGRSHSCCLVCEAWPPLRPL